MLNHFLPSLPLASSVVSMMLFAPHKMAEIRSSAWQRERPNPRIVVGKFFLMRLLDVKEMAESFPFFRASVGTVASLWG